MNFSNGISYPVDGMDVFDAQDPSHENTLNQDTAFADNSSMSPDLDTLSAEVVTNGRNCSSKSKPKKASRAGKWKKPKGMPKRPLSAYNLFFAQERQNLISNGRFSLKKDCSFGKGGNDDEGTAPQQNTKNVEGFSGLAKTIAAKWRSLDDRAKVSFAEQAKTEKDRYKKELAEWKLNQETAEGKATHSRKKTTTTTVSRTPQIKKKEQNPNTERQHSPTSTLYTSSISEPRNPLSDKSVVTIATDSFNLQSSSDLVFDSLNHLNIPDQDGLMTPDSIARIVSRSSYTGNLTRDFTYLSQSFRSLSLQLDEEECEFLFSLGWH